MGLVNKERIIPARLVLLRREKKISQAELTREINERYSSDQIGISTVSMLETGRRPVSAKYMQVIMDYFKVSKAYLLGFTDDPKEELPQKEIDNLIETGGVGSESDKVQILPSDLFRFHLCPIYVEYPNLYSMNGWAIYDDKTSELVFPDRRVKITDSFWNSDKVRLCTLRQEYDTVYSDNSKKPLDLRRLMEQESVLVKMTSPYVGVRSMYDGWYHHNEKKSALINNIGLVLPYEGLGISYNAFSSGDAFIY